MLNTDRLQAITEAKKDIFKEKSLLDAYRKIRLIRPRSHFNSIATVACIVVIGIFVFCDTSAPKELVTRLGKLASDGITFSTTILGFLVAGFTVFATITKPELFTYMAVRKHTDSGLSYLKYNFFLFLNVFIVYLLFAAISLAIRVLYDGDGLNMASWLGSFSVAPEEVSKDVSKILYIFLLGLFIQALLLLKSFVFNTYHVVMTAIRWELENESKAEPRRPFHIRNLIRKEYTMRSLQTKKR